MSVRKMEALAVNHSTACDGRAAPGDGGAA